MVTEAQTIFPENETSPWWPSKYSADQAGVPEPARG
jgi:hypothetical protein